MFKKFLSALIVASLLASTSAYAFGETTQQGNTTTSPNGTYANGQSITYISDFSVSPTTFDPKQGQTVKLNYKLNAAAKVYAYVVSEDDFSVPVVFVEQEAQAAKSYSHTWYGKSGNTVNGSLLEDGEYTVNLYVYDNSGNRLADYSKTVMLGSLATPDVSNLKVTPTTFSDENNGKTTITFDIDQPSYLKVEVKKGNYVVKTFNDYNGNDAYQPGDVHVIEWDGKNNSGNYVTPGVYNVVVTSTNSKGTDTADVDVNFEEGLSHSGALENFKLNPANSWDPVDSVLEIDFDLLKDVQRLRVEAVKGSKSVEIIDDRRVDADDYEEYWDGTDDDGDYVKPGDWKIVITADSDVVTKTISVNYEQSSVKDFFVTKDSFDPSEDEVTTLVFKANADALATVEVFNGSKREAVVLRDMYVSKNRWYDVTWDGMDNDGDEVDDGNGWFFRVFLENPVEDDVYTSKDVPFVIEEDYVSNKKTNVTNDWTTPVYDNDHFDSLEFSYALDGPAEVYLAVYDGTSTSGKSEMELLNYVYQDAGLHTVSWNGKNMYGKKAKDGVYSYKLVSKASGNSKDTEFGSFVIGNSGFTYIDEEDYPKNDELETDGSCGDYYWDVKYLSKNNELCTALAWVTEEGIFSGHPDKSFKPYESINRAEVLKVVLNAFNMPILSLDGTSQGFVDVDPFAWYMPYVRTGKQYGLIEGYADKTARLQQTINRVELLKFVMEASPNYTGYEFSNGPVASYEDVPFTADTAWFQNYASVAYLYDLFNTYSTNGKKYLRPGQDVQRGEVALLLYRMAKADLLK